jgi:hypothetical protein
VTPAEHQKALANPLKDVALLSWRYSPPRLILPFDYHICLAEGQEKRRARCAATISAQ